MTRNDAMPLNMREDKCIFKDVADIELRQMQGHPIMMSHYKYYMIRKNEATTIVNIYLIYRRYKLEKV